MRIGFIGTGGIANHHMKALAKIGVEFAGMTDVDPARAQEAANAYGGRAYADHREMLEKESLDAVFVCVPPFAHTGQELDCIAAGTALFVEKPVSLDLEYARRVEAALEEKGLVSAVGYHWRHMESVREGRRLLADAPIGLMMGYWVGGMPGVWWWRRRDKSGGQLVEQTTHIVDLARYFGGEVESVCGAASSRILTESVEDFDIDEASAAVLRFESGAVATIHSACLTPMWVGLDVVAESVALEIRGNWLKVRRPGQETETVEGQNDPTVDEDRAFLEAVKAKNPAGVASSYSDAVRTLAVTMAMERSFREGRPVALREMM